ncbi:MAG: porin [Gammaproteobacteria bacterium]|nr:porin [Gammaproteobacteria bacterium]
MKIKLLGTALALGLASTAATAAGTIGSSAADWQIYSWQNWTYEFTDVDDTTAVTGDDQKQQRLRNNAAHIGMRGSVETGLSMGGQAVKTNFQCEQFMFFGNGDGGDWCNRNSKISVSGAFGEIMWGNWLTPYNEVVAGHIDPYWDADFTSHTALMGTINSFDYTGPGTNPSAGSGAGFNNGFNKRQSTLVQYWSPSMGGLHFRVATSNGDQGDTEVTSATGPEKLDPRLWEAGVSYTSTLSSGDAFWLAATYSKHDEWAAVDFNCSDSDDTGYRLAGNFTKQWGGGASTRIAAMWENLEYDWEDCAVSLASMVSVDNGSSNLKLEKDTWLVSFTHAFGNGFDIRGTYMDAGEFDCDVTDGCSTEDDTDATAITGGIGYTTPGGTMFTLKYAHVDNEDNSRYDTGFWSADDGGIPNGADSTVWGIGITAGF